MKSKIPSIFIVALVAIFGCGPANAADDALTKRAEQGDANAQFYLGFMYDFGRGVPEDDAMAYAWHNVAAASGAETAKESRGSTKKETTRRL